MPGGKSHSDQPLSSDHPTHSRATSPTHNTRFLYRSDSTSSTHETDISDARLPTESHTSRASDEHSDSTMKQPSDNKDHRNITNPTDKKQQDIELQSPKISRENPTSSRRFKNLLGCIDHRYVLNSTIKSSEQLRQNLLEITNLKGKNEGLTKENEGLTKENEGLKKDNEGLKKDNEGLTKENEGLTKENERFKRDNDDLNFKLDQKCQENIELMKDKQKQLEEVEKRMKSYLYYYQDEKNKNKELVQRDKELNQDKNRLTKENEDLIRERDQLNIKMTYVIQANALYRKILEQSLPEKLPEYRKILEQSFPQKFPDKTQILKGSLPSDDNRGSEARYDQSDSDKELEL